MRKIFVLCMLALLVTVALPVGAQQDGVSNFVFTSEAVWVDEPQFWLINNPVNVRAVPGTDANEPLFSLGPTLGSFVQMVATYDGWGLVRAYDGQGVYVGHGWLSQSVAELAPIISNMPQIQDGTCAVTDKGEQLQVVVRFNEGWVHDSMSTACTLFYEGRIDSTERHDFWVVADNDGTGEPVVVKSDEYLTNGFFWLLEGTGWVHPQNWNVGVGFEEGVTGLALEYPPMIAMFAQDKTRVMSDNGYAWPIRVNRIDGTSVDFEYGEFVPEALAEGAGGGSGVDRCNFESPREMNVTGVFVSSIGAFRSTSVGALGCQTLILWQIPDGTWQLFSFEGARERLEYQFVVAAALIPSNWTGQQVSEYALELISNADLEDGTEVVVNGISRMPESFTIGE